MSGVIYSFNIEVLGVYQEPQSYNETATGGVRTGGRAIRPIEIVFTITSTLNDGYYQEITPDPAP